VFKFLRFGNKKAMKIMIAFFVVLVVAFAGVVVATGDIVYPPIHATESSEDGDGGAKYESKIVDWLK